MGMYTAKVNGAFAETQSVEAISPEDASAKFLNNEGETLTRESATDIEVSDIALVEDEAEAPAEAVEPESA